MPKINLKDNLKFGKTFCPLPFISYHTNVQKRRMLCCISDVEVSTDRLNEIRDSILEEQPVSECDICYRKEELKLFSRRQRQLKDWLAHSDKLHNAIEQYQLGHEVEPIDYDLRYSNLCNLECQTCNPIFSSSIAKAQGKEIPFLQYEPELKINPAAERIYLAGGEPFLIKSFSRLLNDMTNKNCEILINTNVTTLTDHMLTALDKFTNISFTLSIDGYGDLNEKIRKNSVWSEIDANIDILANRYGGHGKMLVNTVVQRDNVNHLLDLGNWVTSKGINHWTLTLLTQPKEFEFMNCPDIHIPEALLDLPVVRTNIENTNMLKYIRDYAKN